MVAKQRGGLSHDESIYLSRVWLDACLSRRKDVECFKCGEPKMNLAKIDFENYATMTEEERKDYADGWLYIHQKAKRET